MKKLLIIVAFVVAGVTQSSAQEHIEALLNSDIVNNKGYSLRVAIKRDPETGEVVKQVKELTSLSGRPLIKEFVKAFKSDRATADVWEECDNGSMYDATGVWSNPKRIYTIVVNGPMITVSTQTIYREEQNDVKK